MDAARFQPAGPLRGTVRPPADKSISHRVAILSAMAEGTSRIHGYLDAADTASSLSGIRALGATVQGSPGEGGELEIRGVGLRGAGEAQIDVGNAGTLLRILPGWLSGQGGQGRGSWALDGDASIRRRPVDRIVDPLRAMGAEIEAREGRLPPLRIRGADLRGIDYRMPVASAQVKSCLLLAALLASGPTTVRERLASRDHTERLLAAAGVEMLVTEGPERSIEVQPAVRIDPMDLEIPGDPSSAAFLACAAVLVPDSSLCLQGVCVNPTRTGLLSVLERMGAPIERERERLVGGEPVADLIFRHSPLQATTVERAEVPATVDELPLVGLLGACAEGETVVEGAEELRHKESDRIAAVVEGLRALGVEADGRPDGFVVRGSSLRGGRLEARGDHRMAMLGAVAGLVAPGGVEVVGMEAAAVSYPGFAGQLREVLGPPS